jgi:hypothetical protein
MITTSRPGSILVIPGGVSCSHLPRAWAKVLLRAPAFAQKKLFSASLKISTVFLSGFLSSKRKELGGRT